MSNLDKIHRQVKVNGHQSHQALCNKTITAIQSPINRVCLSRHSPTDIYASCCALCINAKLLVVKHETIFN